MSARLAHKVREEWYGHYAKGEAGAGGGVGWVGGWVGGWGGGDFFERWKKYIPNTVHSTQSPEQHVAACDLADWEQ